MVSSAEASGSVDSILRRTPPGRGTDRKTDRQRDCHVTHVDPRRRQH
jgi:hypothetical protein